MPPLVRRAPVPPWTRFARLILRPLGRVCRMLLVALSGMAPSYQPPPFRQEDASAEVAPEEARRE